MLDNRQQRVTNIYLHILYKKLKQVNLEIIPRFLYIFLMRTLAFYMKDLKGEDDHSLFSSIYNEVAVGVVRIVGWKIWRNHTTAGGCEVCATPWWTHDIRLSLHFVGIVSTQDRSLMRLNISSATPLCFKHCYSPYDLFNTVTWSCLGCLVLTGAEGGWESSSGGFTALESACDDVIWSNKGTWGNWATACQQQSLRILTWPHL